jgi:hypothetical protein
MVGGVEMRGMTVPRGTKISIALEGAALIVYEDLTLWQVAERIDHPMSSIYKWIMEYLPNEDGYLYEQTRERIEEHKKRGGRYRGVLSV